VRRIQRAPNTDAQRLTPPIKIVKAARVRWSGWANRWLVRPIRWPPVTSSIARAFWF